MLDGYSRVDCDKGLEVGHFDGGRDFDTEKLFLACFGDYGEEPVGVISAPRVATVVMKVRAMLTCCSSCLEMPMRDKANARSWTCRQRMVRWETTE